MKIDITEINKIKLKDGEVLIFKLPDSCPQKQLSALRCVVEGKFPNNEVLLISESVEITKVIRDES